MADPRSAREALVAELLSELDTLLLRAEHLPKTIAEAETHLTSTIEALNEAGDRYRMAVTAFTEQARTELTGYLQLKASETAAKTVEEQRAALQEAARVAFRHAARASTVRPDLGENQPLRLSHGNWGRLVEHGLIAMLASLLTAIFVLLITRSA
jgi:hypothetical protein